MEIRLSIIIPVYNAAKHFEALEETLQSVSGQPEIEIMLINDGSKDDSYQLAIRLAETWSNITVLDKPNGGAASARNLGIKQAKGAYLAFLDADDRMDFDKLLLLLKEAEAKQLDLCAFDLRYINKKGELSGNGLQHPIDYGTLQSGQYFLTQGYQPSSICVFLVRRAFVTGNDLFFHEGITHEDVELSFRWMLKAEKVLFTKEVIYFYYQHAGSVTNQLTADKKKAYLLDEVLIAGLMKAQAAQYTGQIKQVIQKNYNSVTWNLLYSIYRDPVMLNEAFVTEILYRLKKNEMYPIKGALKTKFQKMSGFLLNVEYLYRLLLRRKLQ